MTGKADNDLRAWSDLSDGEKQDLIQAGYEPPVGTILHNNVDLLKRPTPPGEREDDHRYR